MKGVMLILSILLGCTYSYAQFPVQVQPANRDTTEKRVIVRVNAQQELFIDSLLVPTIHFDSLFNVKLESLREQRLAPVVLISADTAALYGTVFRIMRVAKKFGAKVFAVVQ